MSEDFFRVYRGIELNEKIQILEGAGIPGSGGDSAAAPLASVYINTQDGTQWAKVAAGTGPSKWVQMASKADIASQISWREPVVVDSDLDLTLPVGVAGNTITVDGIVINDGARVLFSKLTTGANVYVYDLATGTFIQDINAATSGDMVFVQSGTDTGMQYAYNGTAWVLANQNDLSELANIRAFVGKGIAGNEMPSYTSTNLVTQGVNLEVAVSEIDTKVGAAPTGTSYALTTNTVNQNIQALDGALATVASNNQETTTLNVSTTTNVDSVLSTAVKWIVRAVDSANGNNVYSTEVLATHNGTLVDFTKYATLKLGVDIPGLTFNVTLTGGNTVTLTATATNPVNVTVRRVSVF